MPRRPARDILRHSRRATFKLSLSLAAFRQSNSEFQPQPRIVRININRPHILFKHPFAPRRIVFSNVAAAAADCLACAPHDTAKVATISNSTHLSSSPSPREKQHTIKLYLDMIPSSIVLLNRSHAARHEPMVIVKVARAN